MSSSSEKFSEQYSRIEQQLKSLTQFEQLYTIVEFTSTFQLSYQHFLLQLFQANIQCENNDMFNHTVDDANAPDIVACLLSNSLDKILFTVQLYLPLISTSKISDKLLEAYRNVLIYLDGNVSSPKNFSYKEEQIIHFCQQILFFIQKNLYLQSLSLHIPQLIKLVQTNKFQCDDLQAYHQPLQRYSSVRSQGQPLMNYSSEGLTPNSTPNQPLTRLDINDSGVDLTESSRTNSITNFLSQNQQQHPFMDHTQRTNHPSTGNKHTFVAKTASSPIPEYASVNPATRTPLKSVLSAPPSTVHTDYRNKNGNYQQKHVQILAKSDEEDVDNQQSTENFKSEKNNKNENSKNLTQFLSLRYPTTKINQNQDNVSQYLAIDANSSSMQNTFTQPNTGMRDVPKWLRHLRLHKYDIFFSKMTYDEMMKLSADSLKELQITEGARSKMLLNIKKLKERSSLLKQWLVDMDDAQVDLQAYVEKLNEVMITPMRSKQLELENNSDEDLPSLIMQVLEKVYQKLAPNTSPEVGNSLIGLFDRCYKHEAFTNDQRNVLLQWRGRLANLLQSLGRFEYKTVQSTLNHSSSQRRPGKQPVRNTKSSIVSYYTNHSSNSIQLSKFKSEPQTNNYSDANLLHRQNRSPPTVVYANNDELNDSFGQTSFNCLTSTPQNSTGTYVIPQQRQPLTRKQSINPYDETNTNAKTKLCKTYSDPNRVRFFNSTQINNMQLSASQQQQNLFRIISSPYSQQRNYVSRSPPTSNTIEIPSSPIKKCFSDTERLAYYETNNNSTPLSNISNTTDIENADDQRHHNTEIESLCRQITESAMSDNIDSSIEHKEDILNVKQLSNNSTDTHW